jgi:hypothetical protein
MTIFVGALFSTVSAKSTGPNDFILVLVVAAASAFLL